MSRNPFKRKNPTENEKWNIRSMFGAKLGFAQQEAYKLLRSNLMFSFADDGACRVIGVTSACQGEGKSSTACNIAYAFSEVGCRVLLLEADMRCPTIAKKLKLENAPGISNLLVKKENYKEAVQRCPQAPNMDVMTSGYTPPNPSELLCSDRMKRLIGELSADYDYIIVDLPPVTAVSDTVAMSKLLHGVVLVVRGGFSDHRMLDEALRQLRMADLRVLGFVYRDADVSERPYHYRRNETYYKEIGGEKPEVSESKNQKDRQ